MGLPSICLIAAANPSVKEDGPVRPFLALGWSGSRGGDLLPGSKVLLDQLQWSSVWESLGREAPPLDFNVYIAVIAFAGERERGGYSIEFVDAVLVGDDLLIRWRVLRPSPDTMTIQVITRPWAIATYRRPKGTVLMLQMEDRVLPPSGSVQ